MSSSPGRVDRQYEVHGSGAVGSDGLPARGLDDDEEDDDVVDHFSPPRQLFQAAVTRQGPQTLTHSAARSAKPNQHAGYLVTRGCSQRRSTRRANKLPPRASHVRGTPTSHPDPLQPKSFQTRAPPPMERKTKARPLAPCGLDYNLAFFCLAFTLAFLLTKSTCSNVSLAPSPSIFTIVRPVFRSHRPSPSSSIPPRSPHPSPLTTHHPSSAGTGGQRQNWP